jgi:hypothetical protein
MVADRGDDPVAFARLAQIGNEAAEMPGDLQLLGLGLHRGDIALDMPDGDDRMPFARQAECHRLAQAAQAARHQRDTIFAIVLGHGFLPVRKKHFSAKDAKDTQRTRRGPHGAKRQ